MLKMLSDYNNRMEDLVKQRGTELYLEKKQVEEMLYSILPRFADFKSDWLINWLID